MFVFKIICVGDKSVGKLTYVLKLVEFPFKTSAPAPFSRGFNTVTKGLTIKGEEVLIIIKKPFRSFSSEVYESWFYQDVKGVVLMYDRTRPNTFNHLEEWRRIILEKVGEIPMIIVGTKSDLEELIEVSNEEVAEFSKKYGNLPYYNISSKNEYNVHECLISLTELILGKAKNKTE